MMVDIGGAVVQSGQIVAIVELSHGVKVYLASGVEIYGFRPLREIKADLPV